MRTRALTAIVASFCACSSNQDGLDGSVAADGDSTTSIDAGVIADSGTEEARDATVDATVDASVVPQSGLTIQLDTGKVRGKQDGDLRAFLGIPFAEPPVGSRRFRPPVPVEPWTDIRETTDFGPACPQVKLGPELILGDFAGPQSEDCLSINVWAHDDAVTRPVMVFIYGGGFLLGSSAWPIYDARELARNADVVVASFNYRVGPLGFLSTEALASESEEDSAGNYGIRDQVEALRWVQRNIAGFGGDPGNVTIFGESAGAISVCTLFGVPQADALFHKAIMESGFCALSEERDRGLLGARPSIAAGEALAASLGCGDPATQLSCLRAMPVADLAEAVGVTSIFFGDIDALGANSPHVDGAFVVEQPISRLRTSAGDKPFIAGSNSHEGILFAASELVVSRAALRDGISRFAGDDESALDRIMDLYPASEFFLPSDAWIAFLGDLTFICPGLSAAEAASGGAMPSFAYHFRRSPLLTRAVGAAHGIELPYVFGTFSSMGIIPTASDDLVHRAIQGAWARFAQVGAPELSPRWRPYEPAAATIAIFDDPVEMEISIRNGRCTKLKELGLVY
ncbi:MAG: carboxylesterase family protein [Deltaproteobacteria bacterium]|nr:carboxylesterase family protein [Deltaproteobacteria bacterium]